MLHYAAIYYGLCPMSFYVIRSTAIRFAAIPTAPIAQAMMLFLLAAFLSSFFLAEVIILKKAPPTTGHRIPPMDPAATRSTIGAISSIFELPSLLLLLSLSLLFSMLLFSMLFFPYFSFLPYATCLPLDPISHFNYQLQRL